MSQAQAAWQRRGQLARWLPARPGGRQRWEPHGRSNRFIGHLCLEKRGWWEVGIGRGPRGSCWSRIPGRKGRGHRPQTPGSMLAARGISLCFWKCPKTKAGPGPSPTSSGLLRVCRPWPSLGSSSASGLAAPTSGRGATDGAGLTGKCPPAKSGSGILRGEHPGWCPRPRQLLGSEWLWRHRLGICKGQQSGEGCQARGPGPSCDPALVVATVSGPLRLQKGPILTWASLSFLSGLTDGWRAWSHHTLTRPREQGREEPQALGLRLGESQGHV